MLSSCTLPLRRMWFDVYRGVLGPTWSLASAEPELVDRRDAQCSALACELLCSCQDEDPLDRVTGVACRQYQRRETLGGS